MSQKILVAYATRAGSTAEVAKEIGDVLIAKGFAVDVIPVRKVKDISFYRAAIRAWAEEAVTKLNL